jgi:hypothetical protein
MTGRAYTHRDLPESHRPVLRQRTAPRALQPGVPAAVQRVVGNSRDPLPLFAKDMLGELEHTGELGFEDATQLLPNLVCCFDRQHQEPRWSDYQALLAESKEMAWIATEGNAFNHATDRVADVGAVADRQRELGRPVKAEVEVSKSGRVRQTAFQRGDGRAAVPRRHGSLAHTKVPGSFHEFITRDEERRACSTCASTAATRRRSSR